MFKVWLLLLLLLTKSFVECLSGFPCGPNMACTCNVQLHGYNKTKMGCHRKDLTISEICKSVGSTSHSTVTELDASDNNIFVIKNSSEMTGCENIEVLDLSFNFITSIEQHALDGLHILKDLRLNYNELNVYRFDGLDNFTKLATLETLRVNVNIKFYGKRIYPTITFLPNLRILYLDGLTNTAFDMSYANVTNLTLSGTDAVCKLGNLTFETFQYLTSVRHLNLAGCNIENIAAETFTMLTSLEKLDLSYNRRLGFRSLRNVSYGLQFTDIKFLDYSYVYSTFGLGSSVRKKDFCYLKNSSIAELVLNGNKIELFETNSLMLLPKTLEVIHLDDNKLSFAPYVCQRACVQNIKQLYISGQNQYHDPTHYIDEDGRITFDKAEVDDEYDNCPYMKDEFLKNVSREITNCHFYRTNKSYFNISSFKLAINPAQTTKIVMARNGLQKDFLSYLTFQSNVMEHIDLSFNLLSSWTTPMGPFPNLKYLDLSGNYCWEVSKHFFLLNTNLETLILKQNELGLALQSRSRMFNKLSLLRKLDLSSNEITHIPQNFFDKLFNLEELFLESNSMHSLEIDTDKLFKLNSLRLTLNSLPTLPMSLVQHLEKISERRNIPFSIGMYENPIKVTCLYQKFLKWMIQHQSNFVDFEFYTFVGDKNVIIQPYDIEKYVKRLSKSCRSYTLLIVICSIGLSVFLAVVIGGVIYRNRWKLRYMLYMAKRRYNGYMAIPDEEPQHNYKYDAFISYSADDIRFILDEIIPRFEEHDFNLCIHQRDFLPGNAIADNIMNAIKNSKMTVVILTEAYLKSEWCVYEFNMARMESLYSRNNEISLMLVMLENVPIKHMSLEMVQWIKDNSYLEYKGDPEYELLFWDSLKDALS